MTKCTPMDLPIIESTHNISIEDEAEIKETICTLIDDYMKDNILDYKYADLRKKLQIAIIPLLNLLYNPILQYNLPYEALLTECLIIYFNVFALPRSYRDIHAMPPLEKRYVTAQLKRMRSIPQHEQNSIEWFHCRWNLITASSAYKALGSDSAKNSLIYSKCKPIDKGKYSTVNINSATHHGHKFEPLSTKFYEEMFNTEIEEFGCLPDQNDLMLGASPDGINCKADNKRFGYLLEIKNPVSRKLNGIPKLEYWIQMQFQMHVTQLPYCDFLETQFKYYESEDHFNKDGAFNKTAIGNHKGIIVCFHDGNKPVYKYPPWNIDKESFDKWYDEVIDEDNALTWIDNAYWYLEKYSCVSVAYNKQWFQAALPYFKSLWNTILKERISGYSHRAAKKRIKKPLILSPISPPLNAVPNVPDITLMPHKIILKIRHSIHGN